MKGEVHAHIDTEPKQESHSFCARTPMGDMPEHVEGDVKMCPHGKVFRWIAALEGYDRWSQLDPILENKEWRAARAAVRSAEGRLMPPPPPPITRIRRDGGYPATRPVPSGLSGAIQDAMGDGQRVEKGRSTGAPPAEPNESVLTVELRDRNALGFERKRTFTVQANRMPSESSRRFNLRIFGLAMEKLAESDAR